ncbi:MAG: efflux RND transporter periplasmic adaptor subunit, partial [Bryobacteraceae bacterium]|nr:efflux RND transporter periplasmic adaptor subunit [Bryobacteraceae bacterium]
GGGGGGGGGSSEFSMTLQNLAKPGSRVSKGQVVAEFDRQFMLNRLEDYKSSVGQLDASMKKLLAEIELYKVQHAQTIDVSKAQLEKAQLDMKTLPVRGDMDAERLRLALEEAQAQLKQLQSEVRFVQASAQAQSKIAELEQKAADLELKRVQMTADRMLMKAPIDGITVMQQTFAGSEFRQIQEGDQIFPGQFFMQIVEPGSMVINASVNQVDAEKLRIGQKAKVRFDAYPGLELSAHVVSVAAVTKTGGFRASFVKEIPVRLKLDQMDNRVIPDLSVSCDVVIESDQTDSVVIPREALSLDTAGAPNKRTVWVKSAAGAWERREVEVGLMNFVQASIRSGLKAGEVVALDTPPQPQKPSQSS